MDQTQALDAGVQPIERSPGPKSHRACRDMAQAEARRTETALRKAGLVKLFALAVLLLTTAFSGWVTVWLLELDLPLLLAAFVGVAVAGGVAAGVFFLDLSGMPAWNRTAAMTVREARGHHRLGRWFLTAGILLAVGIAIFRVIRHLDAAGMWDLLLATGFLLGTELLLPMVASAGYAVSDRRLRALREQLGLRKDFAGRCRTDPHAADERIWVDEILTRHEEVIRLREEKAEADDACDRDVDGAIPERALILGYRIALLEEWVEKLRNIHPRRSYQDLAPESLTSSVLNAPVASNGHHPPSPSPGTPVPFTVASQP